MNIFYLDKNPKLAAQMLCDKHVVKMVNETVQILSTVRDKLSLPRPVAPTHPHHPSIIWAGESWANYMWLWQYLIAICKEFEHRYHHKHDYEEFIKGLRCLNFSLFPTAKPTPVRLAVPDKFKHIKNPVVAYRKYYKTKPEEWALNYTNRRIPKWLL